MIKFDKDEFSKPQIYSTNDKYETRCNVTKEIIKDFEQLQQENKKYKGVIDKAIELTKNLLKTEDRGYYQIIFKEILKSLGDTEI